MPNIHNRPLRREEISKALEILAETDALVNEHNDVLDGFRAGKEAKGSVAQTTEERQTRFFQNVQGCFERYQSQFGTHGLYSVNHRLFRENCFAEAAEDTVRGDSLESAYIMDVLEEAAFDAPLSGETVPPPVQIRGKSIQKK